MAKLKRKLDKSEWQKLTADVQGLYTEKSGSYVLDADDAEELSGALEALKRENREARDKLKAFEGIDPEQHKKLLEDTAKAQRQRDLDEKNFDKILGEERDKHGDELKKRDKLEQSLRGQLEEALIDGELTRAIAAYPGAKDKLLMPAARQSVKLREVGGKLRAVVLNEKGEPRLKADAKNADDYMAPSDLIAEYRNNKDYAAAFPANAQRDNVRILVPENRGRDTQQAQVNRIAEQVRAGNIKLDA